MTDTILKKWEPVINTMSNMRGTNRNAMAKILESQSGVSNKSKLITEATNVTGGLAKFDSILMDLAVRSAHRLIAFDFANVQPMRTSTEELFILKNRYNNQAGNDMRTSEPDTSHTGSGTHTGTDPFDVAYSTGVGLDSATAETTAWKEMGITVERETVTARGRQLKSTLSLQFLEDLFASWGADGVDIVTQMLLEQLGAELNRELVRTIYGTATAGAQFAATPGTLDLSVDFNSAFIESQWKGLLLSMVHDSNRVFTESRIGRGNVYMVSPDVSAVLSAIGALDTPEDLDDDSTFVGTIGKARVHIDPYVTTDFYATVHRGPTFGSAIYYAPYILAQVVESKLEDTFEPAIGVRTRYGLVSNPFTFDAVSGKNSLIRMAKVENVIA